MLRIKSVSFDNGNEYETLTITNRGNSTKVTNEEETAKKGKMSDRFQYNKQAATFAAGADDATVGWRATCTCSMRLGCDDDDAVGTMYGISVSSAEVCREITVGA